MSSNQPCFYWENFKKNDFRKNENETNLQGLHCQKWGKKSQN
jgi:hypothetical protein